mgnify:CR=1 FL=1
MEPTNLSLPHNRSSAFFDEEGNFSQRFEESIDLWATALLNDDGIVSPIQGISKIVNSKIITKEDGIFVGRAIIKRICNFWAPNLQLKWNYLDGDRISKGDELVEIIANKNQLLKFERPILNILGRLSGIATTSNQWSEQSKIPIASTRKTTWGLLDKWAVHMGGALTHRLDRNDALMIKENDLAAQYSKYNPKDRIKFALENIEIETSGAFITIEVRDKNEAIMAAKTWNSINKNIPLTIMLDNIKVMECNEIISEILNLNLSCVIYFEASGGITIENLETWQNSLVNVISTSSIHRGTKPLDISLLLEEA